MAFPTDFDSMVTYMGVLMQDTSAFAPALTVGQKEDLVNAALKAWSSDINPRIETVSGLSLGIDLSSAGAGRVLTSVTNISDILAAYSTASALADTGTPMERIELHEMIALQAEDTTQSDTITHWAYQKAYTTTAANVNKIMFYVHPFSDGTALVGLAIRRSVATLSGSQVPNLSPEEVDYVCRMAAWDGARLAGRSPEFRDAIVAPIPEKAQVYLRKYKNILRPTKRFEEEPV